MKARTRYAAMPLSSYAPGGPSKRCRGVLGAVHYLISSSCDVISWTGRLMNYEALINQDVELLRNFTEKVFHREVTPKFQGKLND